MPDESTLDIVIRAKNLASGVLKQVQKDVQDATKAAAAPAAMPRAAAVVPDVKSVMASLHAQQVAILKQGLAAPGDLRRRTRLLAQETLGRLTAGPAPGAVGFAAAAAAAPTIRRIPLPSGATLGREIFSDLARASRDTIRDAVSRVRAAAGAMPAAVPRGAQPPSPVSFRAPDLSLWQRAQGLASRIGASISGMFRGVSRDADQAGSSLEGAKRKFDIFGVGVLHHRIIGSLSGTLILRGAAGMLIGIFGAVASAVGSIIHILDSAIQAILRFAQAILSAAVAALHKLVLAVGVAGAAIMGFTAILLRVGFGYEDFRRNQIEMLAVLLKSPAAATAAYNSMKKYAESLRLDPRPIIEAGIALTDFGLDAQRWLPVAANLAARARKPILEMAELLGRAGEEMMLMRALAQMRIGPKELATVGVKFRQPTPGSAPQPMDRAQLLAGIERLMKRDFPDAARAGISTIGRIWQGMKNIADNAAREMTLGAYAVVQRAGDRLFAQWEKFKTSTAWQTIKERLGGALAYVLDLITRLIARAPQLAERIAAMLQRAPIEEFLTGLRAISIFLWNTLSRTVETVSKFIGESLRAAGFNGATGFQAILIVLAEVAAGTDAVITTIIENWAELSNWMKRVAVSIKAVVIEVWTFAKTILGAILQIAARPLALLGLFVNVLAEKIISIIALIKQLNPANWNAAAFERIWAPVAKFRKELEATDRIYTAMLTRGFKGGWEEVQRQAMKGIKAKVSLDFPEIDPLSLARKAADAARAAAGKARQDMSVLLTQTVKLPIMPKEDPGKAVADGAKQGIVEGMKEVAKDFVSQVWGGTAEMLKKAGLTAKYYEQIGVPTAHGESRGGAQPPRQTAGGQASAVAFPERAQAGLANLRLAGAGAGPGINLNLTVNASPMLAAELRSPSVRREIETAIESIIERVARRFRG
jgi:hypothetical protein